MGKGGADEEWGGTVLQDYHAGFVDAFGGGSGSEYSEIEE